MGAFVVRQHRIPNPLLNLTPMHNRLFAPVCVLVVVAMMTTFSMSVLLPLYFEGALGTTALAAGALLLAPILVNAVTSLVGGRVMDKRGSWPLLPAGFAIITVGQLAVCLCAPPCRLLACLWPRWSCTRAWAWCSPPPRRRGCRPCPPSRIRTVWPF